MHPRQCAWLIALLAAGACGDDDTGQPDGAPGDAGGIDAVPSDADTRYKLSQTGLYSDIATLTLVPEAVEFAPSHPLWSDGAEKRRWIILPAGTQIDTSDMDHWRFPTGTKLFKEFSLAGQRLETRLIEKIGDGDLTDDYWVGAFIWEADGSDAVFTSSGQMDVLGTDHDVPSSIRCWTCHIGETGHILGFSAVQLARDPGAAGVTVESLVADGLLTVPPPAGAEMWPPGDAVTRTALGTLHGNCGHCHNPDGTAWSDTDQILRLDVTERDPTMTTTYTTTVGMPTIYWHVGTATRVVPGDPEASAIVIRMATRDGTTDQMPPRFASEVVDTVGVEAVRAWILSLP